MRLTVMRMDLSKDKSIEVVGAREIYKLLGLSERFSPWTERNFKKFNAVSGRDYFKKTEDLPDNGVGRPRLEYLISIRLAKKIVLSSEKEVVNELYDKLEEIDNTDYENRIEVLKQEFKMAITEIGLSIGQIYEVKLKKELLLKNKYGI